MSRSFESINYMLRPNKNVERKLICRSLLALRSHFPIENYRYIGFGSMWFSDFILMHRVVGISDMISIEHQRPRRVEFNRPFSCVSIKFGTASKHLEHVLDGKKSVIWLDYDGGLDSALAGDVEMAVAGLPSGSVVLVTVNAMVDQLKGRTRDGAELSPIDAFVEITDTSSARSRESELTRADFPKLVAEIVHNRLRSAVLSFKPDCSYLPIWSIQYADQAVMITVGGMVVDDADATKVFQSKVFDLASSSRENLYKIDLPVLTEKERRALDRILPFDGTIDPETLEFELTPSQIRAYQEFYLDFPSFNELAL